MTASDQAKAFFARVTMGPAPYSRGPNETVRDPACGKYNEPDAKNCDQCGHVLPGGPTEPYVRGPGEDIECPSCHKYNAGDARYCSQCGAKIPGTAFEKNNPAVSGPSSVPQPQAPADRTSG